MIVVYSDGLMGSLLWNCWCVAGSKAYLHSAANAIGLMLLQTKSQS